MWIIHESRAACGQLAEQPATGQRKAPDGSPGATPKSRPVRSSPAEGSLGRIPRGPPSGPSHHFRRGRRPGCQDPSLGHWARRRAPPALLALLRRRALLAPTRVIGTDARCRQPAWDISTDARYIPLAVTTAPSQCRQPPRGADNARPHSHHRGSTAAVEAPVLRVAHTRTPIYATRAAHKGGIKPLCAALCCLIPSLVCDMGWGRPTRAAVPVCPVVRQGDGRKGDAGRLYGGTGGCAAAPFLGHALAGLPFK